jgi:glycine hydroxymethyltransferase
MEKKLDEVHITVNKNTIPNETQSPFVTSGIRVGTPAATSRGFREEDMKIIGQLIWDTATAFDEKQGIIRDSVQALCEKYPLYD